MSLISKIFSAISAVLAVVVLIFLVSLILLQLLWGTLIPELFPGGVVGSIPADPAQPTKNLLPMISPTIDLWTSCKLALFLAFIGGFLKVKKIK